MQSDVQVFLKTVQTMKDWNKLFLGMDIGGTYVRLGAVSEKGGTVFFEKKPQNEIFCGADPLESLEALIGKFIEKHEIDGKIEAMCICFPATVDAENGVVLQTPNISEMDNLPVSKVLNRRLGFPVTIDKDVNAAVIFDVAEHNISKREIVTAFYIGTGVGNAIMIGGKLFRGNNGVAGELGHIPNMNDNRKCDCGNRGCMELSAGGKALTALLYGQLQGETINSIFENCADHEAIHAYLEAVACAISTEINILDPGYVLIGGGVPSMRGFPREQLKALIYQHVRKPLPAERLNIVFVEDAEEKGVIGAAMIARGRSEQEGNDK